ncbi:MAG: hypothetical protein OEZ21_11425 [Candidatus Bathyarchaeota archaeon]|nr:hypothetical protein [Candidatus Bathyarchaeota archaeon]MDH5747542.1 hypothetical protein [Candidatus Bathyarchaeota archaeon]
MKLKMKDEKVVGYVLLAIGIAMIFFSVYQMVQVFTGASPPPNLFNFSDIRLTMPGETESSLLISGEELNKLAAMVFWYMLMFFIMYAGGKIASLGVNMIREIKVEVKEPMEKPETDVSSQRNKNQQKEPQKSKEARGVNDKNQNES